MSFLLVTTKCQFHKDDKSPNLPNVHCHIIMDFSFVSKLGNKRTFMGLLIILSQVKKLFIKLLWNLNLFHKKQSKLLQYIRCSLLAKLVYLWSKIFIYSLLFIDDRIKDGMQWLGTDHINLVFCLSWNKASSLLLEGWLMDLWAIY